MPKINHISFDLDGTLIDSLPLMRESWTHATKKIGVDTPWIQFRENIGLQFEKICANLGLENVSNELADEYFGFNRENLHKIQPMPKLPPNFAKFAADVQSNVNCELHVGLHNLSTLYQKASICIGSGGVMLWERCLFGLPSIVIPIVDDQKPSVRQLSIIGAVMCVSNIPNTMEDAILVALMRLHGDVALRRSMSVNSQKVMSRWPNFVPWTQKVMDDYNG